MFILRIPHSQKSPHQKQANTFYDTYTASIQKMPKFTTILCCSIHVQSSTAIPNPHLSSISPKTMLQNHLEWRIFNSDSFISFNSLLGIAVQNAINKAASGFGLNEIYICGVDTRKINHDALYPARTLCEIHDLPNADKTQHRYFTNEYLAHPVLDVSGASYTVSIGTLIENGFGDLAPEVQMSVLEMSVGGGRQVVQGPICQLRFFFDKTTPAQVVTEAEANLALLLALKFGKEWASMLTVALNVRKRVSWDPELLRLASDFTGTHICLPQRITLTWIRRASEYTITLSTVRHLPKPALGRRDVQSWAFDDGSL